ncbi:MAG: hypothetical protein ACW963_00035 [Candidatus Sifarchaeia archaeon]|jgi:nucleoid-associated protein YgaU
MATRYDDRSQNLNNSDLYYNVFKKKGLRQIVQYDTAVLTPITPEDMQKLTIIDHIWKRGDHFYKLAAQYYGDPTYWWVIAQFNNRPTEAGLAFGDIVLIPNPLEDVLKMYANTASTDIPPAGGY